MLMELFGYPPEKGFQMAKEVDTQGRVIVLTTTLEHAELKRDQIHAYGKDARSRLQGLDVGHDRAGAGEEMRNAMPMRDECRTRCRAIVIGFIRHSTLVICIRHSPMPTSAPSPSAARSTSTRRSTCVRGWRGWAIARPSDGEPADLCIVNTCTVTVEGEAKSRKLIRQLARQNPGAEIVVMGCYATPGGRGSGRPARRGRGDHRQAATSRVAGPPRTGRRSHGHLHVRPPAPGLRQGAGRLPRWSAATASFRRCGPCLSSRPVEDVLEEVRRLVEQRASRDRADRHSPGALRGGRRQAFQPDRVGLVRLERSTCGTAKDPAAVRLESLTYGTRWNLARLVRRIAELDGEFRMRLSSLEAAEVTPELIAVMADYPERVCPHLHISMQSGSDAVLRRMRRRWPAGRFIERCLRGSRQLGPAGPDDRRDRRLSGRDGGGFRGHVPGGRGGGLLEAAHLPLQPTGGDTGG